MTQAEIDELSNAVLTADELVKVWEMCVDKTQAQVSDACGLLEAPQRRMMRAYITQYFDTMPHQTLAVKGGVDGRDYDNTRDRASVSANVRRMLGFPAMSVSFWQDQASQVQARRGVGARNPFRRGSGSGSVNSRSTW